MYVQRLECIVFLNHSSPDIWHQVDLTKLEAGWLDSLGWGGHRDPGKVLFPFTSAWTTGI